jgi:hypothetical protein
MEKTSSDDFFSPELEWGSAAEVEDVEDWG